MTSPLLLDLVKDVFETGKNISFFLETLCEHYRQILYIKIYGDNPKPLPVSSHELEPYLQSAKLYTHEQCLYILDLILRKSQTKIQTTLSKRVALENLLIQIIRSHHRISADSLIQKLEGLKGSSSAVATNSQPAPATIEPPPIKKVETSKKVEPAAPVPKKEPAPAQKAPKLAEKIASKADSKKDLSPSKSPAKGGAKKEKKQYNTLLQFAAVELEGSLKNEGK